LEHPLDVILYSRNHLSRKFPFPGHVSEILITPVKSSKSAFRSRSNITNTKSQVVLSEQLVECEMKHATP
jgi:hypothetical protein